jgi:hypothetical protein
MPLPVSTEIYRPLPCHRQSGQPVNLFAVADAMRIAASANIGGATRKFRFLRFPVGKYLIVYEIGNDEIVVHYIRHSARARPWEGE